VSPKPVRPRWWQLFGVLLLGVVLLAISHELSMSADGHTLSQFVIVVVVFGLMSIWINTNAAALLDEATRLDLPEDSQAGHQAPDRRSSQDERSYFLVESGAIAGHEGTLAGLQPLSLDVAVKPAHFEG
jgi:hypothetical protein